MKLSGCAIEFRVNAEDSLTDFSPTIGRVEYLQVPHGPGVRVDTALQEGMTISPYYDSLVAKLITYGGNFEQARKRALVALDEFSIFGIETTIPFHRELVRNDQFARGEMNTNFIETSGILKRIPRLSENSLNDHHFMIAALLLSHNQFSNNTPSRQVVRSQASKRADSRQRRGRFIDAI